MIRKEFSTSRERRDIKSLRLDNGLDRWIDPDGKTSRLDHFRQCVVQCDDVRVARELYFRQERAQRQGAADVRDKVGEVERGEARIDDLAVHAIGDTAVSGNGCREVFNLERALEPRGEKAAKRRDGARKGAERERVHHEHRATYGGDAGQLGRQRTDDGAEKHGDRFIGHDERLVGSTNFGAPRKDTSKVHVAARRTRKVTKLLQVRRHSQRSDESRNKRAQKSFPRLVG